MGEVKSMNDTEISDLASSTTHSKATRSTTTTTGTSSVISKENNNRWSSPRNKNTKLTHIVPSFIAANVDLYGKVYIKGPPHPVRNSEAYKSNLTYI